MLLIPARFIFWGRLDFFLFFFFEKWEKKNENIRKISENPMEIKKKEDKFILSCYEGQYIILF